jgi:pyruvate/2-oxoglutarate dehydrogenase complex dihydrolipoamide acyltransferase (E2) component
LNARWAEEGIYLVDPIDIGIAVATEDGLVVPVIHDADRKKLTEISVELGRLTRKAQTGQLDLKEITGGTFTITNLGAFGIDTFTPIVNPPETGILGVGRIAERPVGRAGQIVLRQTMFLSLSVDHRIVDGAPAARFLQRIGHLLEEPYSWLLEGV